MAAARGGVTAHIARASQDQEQITTLVMSEVQVLELISLLMTGLPEKAAHRDGHQLAIWKDIPVQKCHANPAGEGGAPGWSTSSDRNTYRRDEGEPRHVERPARG